MLGQDVVRVAGGDAAALTRAELDVTDADAVREVLTGSTVINCAAYTDVDGAESDPERAHAVNAVGARNVSQAAERVLYVSTDYVFDG
jgi:dTDP-4-dehydrorhamnose reductase